MGGGADKTARTHQYIYHTHTNRESWQNTIRERTQGLIVKAGQRRPRRAAEEEPAFDLSHKEQ